MPFCSPRLLASVTCTLLLQLPLAGLNAPALAQTSGTGRNSAFFQKAKKELNPTYYFLYRIVDRLARANGLDQTPWRIINPNKYDINAFASEVNLIAVYTGLLDVLAGDADAIACVVGHEMAHHIERHIALKQVDVAKAKQRLEARKQELIRQEQSRRTASQGWSLITSIVKKTTGVHVPINPIEMSNPDQMKQDLQNASTSENQTLAVASQQMEFEADRIGYQYMARAGFDPKGCLRVMAVLGRMPDAEFDGTHPAIPRRAEQLQTLMTEQPPQRLAAEGRTRLQGSTALTYAVSADGASLRVNSRFGSSRDGFVMSDI